MIVIKLHARGFTENQAIDTSFANDIVIDDFHGQPNSMEWVRDD